MTPEQANPMMGSLREALAQRDRDATNRAVAGLLAARAPLGADWKRIAQLMQVSGEYRLAHAAIDAFVSATGSTPRALYEKVALLTQTGRLRDAHALLESLPEAQMDPAARAYVLGNTALTLGLIAQARAELEKVVRSRPGWGPAWLTLASALDFATDPLGERLLADVPAAQNQAAEDQARFHYALGKLHHDRGQHDAAFAAFAMGAALLSPQARYSRQGDAANAQAAMTGFDNTLIERLNQRQTVATARPIFVTGLPRSGTTLVEQILTSHSAVADGGELNSIQHVAVAAGGNSGTALQAYLDKGGTLEKLGSLYLHLLAERFGDEGRIVDKTIDNSRFLGLIAAILPQAPLIWMRRDPLDTAWSCFRTFFIHGVAWSYSLSDIAYHFALEDRLVDFWQARLGARLLVVPYRALVDAPQDWTLRILAHCGLPEEAAVHDFHRTERVVATASALQVRRPVNRSGIGVADPYRLHLQPFVDAYRGAGGGALEA